MTDYSKRQNIDALVEEVAADPSRADAVKNALKHMVEPGRLLAKKTVKKPQVVEPDDFFDNFPV